MTDGYKVFPNGCSNYEIYPDGIKETNIFRHSGEHINNGITTKNLIKNITNTITKEIVLEPGIIALVDSDDNIIQTRFGDTSKFITAQINDPVKNPSHYTFSKFEVIDVIEEWNLPFHLSNVIKYVSRAGKKSKDTEIQDLKKAQFYLNRYINNLESK